MTSQEVIKKKVKPVVNVIDGYPVGCRIESQWEAPEGYVLEKLVVDGIPVEHLYSKDKKNGNVMYQIHGGGFFYSYIDPYREAAVLYSQYAEVYSIDYSVLPNSKYPKALDECVEVYNWILEQGISNKNIIFVGDSAGGNLVLTTALKIRDNKIPMPKAVIALSPWGNIGTNYSCRKMNYENDLVLGKYGMRLGNEVYHSRYTDEKKFSEPYVSPVYADYHGFPDLLIIVGTYEILYEDSKKLAEAAKKANVNCTLLEYEGMSHDFPILVQGIEESNDALEKMGEFIRKEFK